MNCVFSHAKSENMIKSMTGYGKASGAIENLNTIVEIRSLNSKSLDLSLRVPSNFKAYEMDIRTMVNDKLERGKVEISINRTDGNSNKSTINRPLVISYFEELTALEKELGTDIKDKLSLVLGMPDALLTEKIEADKAEWNALKSLIGDALDAIDNYRISEGDMLKKDLLTNIENIAKLKDQVQPIADNRVDKIKERIRKNLKTNLEDIAVDENRFEQELIYYIEKMDVNEELIRLQGNIDYFMECINTDISEGKKLRFISQELGREINTLGAKSYDADMQKMVVMMKDELEKIKEQLLNVL
ncbi:MAG: hypothetical protein ACI8XB_002824 [Patiriisocius sp.]|jgi:uncharacterized protein (TIGR00255 family)